MTGKHSCEVVLVWLCLALYAPIASAQDAPTKIEVRRRLALQLTEAGNHLRAIQEYRKVLEQDPKDGESTRGCTRSLMALGRLEEARRELEPLANDPARRELQDRIMQGVLYSRMGKTKEGRDLADSIAQTPKASERERFDLAGLWMDLGQADKARAILVTLPPSLVAKPEGLELRANVATALGDRAEATRLNRLLGRRDEQTGQSPWDRVDELNRAGRRDEAFALAMRLLSSGRPTAAQIGMGIDLAIVRGDLRLAERLLARIPESDRSVDAELARVAIHSARGRLLTAERILQRLSKRYPRDARVRLALLTVIVDQGDYERGRRTMEGGRDRLVTADDLKLMVRIYRGLGRSDCAEVAAAELVRRVNRRPDEILGLAEFLIDQRQGALAIRLLEDNTVPHRFRDHRAVLMTQALIVNQSGENEIMKALARVRGEKDLDVSLVVRLARLLISMGHEMPALRILEGGRTTSLPPQAFILKAQAIYRTGGRRSEALGIAGQLDRSSRDLDVSTLMELIDLYSELSADEKALDLLTFLPQEPPWAFTADLTRARILYVRMARCKIALRLIDKMIAAPSTDMELNLGLATLLVDIHETRRADILLGKLKPVGDQLFRYGLVMAKCRLRGMGDRKTARQRLLELRRMPARDASDTIELAEAFLELPDRKIALKLLEAIDPPSWLRFRHQAVTVMALVRMNRFKAAERILDGVLRNCDSSPEKKATAIELAIVLKHTKTARELFDSLPDWWCDSYEGFRLGTVLQFSEQKYRKVLEASERMAARRPLDPEPIFLQGQALLGLKEYGRSLPIFVRLVERDAEQEEWATGRGQALRGLDRAQEALPIHMRLANRYMGIGEAPPLPLITEAAAALSDAGKARAAHDFYQRALELCPGDPDIRKAMAGVLGRLDRHEEAISTFKQGMRLKPEESDRAALGGYLREVGSRERARRLYKSALIKDPENLDAKQGLAGIMAEKNWTRRGALALYEDILARKPNDHNVRAAFAATLAREGFYSEADEEIMCVEAARPDHVEAQKVRAALDLAHRYPSAAEEIYTKIELPDPTDPTRDIGLADVSANRGKGYLRDEVRHVMNAKRLAPERRVVTERMQTLFLPQLGIDFSGFSGSDRLSMHTRRMTVGGLLDEATEGKIEVISRQVTMDTTSTGGTDLALSGLWNCIPGWTLSGGFAAGQLGTSRTDLLPWTEARFRSLDGPGGLAEYRRLRIDDSPMALIAGLKSNTYRGMIDYERGPFKADASYEIDAISDGNKRKILVTDLSYRPFPLVSIDLQYQKRSADRVPVPFELYYAPLTYQSASVGVEYTTPRWGPFNAVMGGAVRADKQDGQNGSGQSARLRLNRDMGPLAGVYVGAEYVHSSLNRRFDTPTPYNQTSYQAGYNTRF